MTFQQVLDMVRDTAKAVNPTGTFIHGRNSDGANSSALPYPRIMLYPFTQDREPNNTFRRTSNLLFSFVEKDEGFQDEAIREGIISRMDVLSQDFIDRLELDYETDVQFTAIRSEPQYQILEGVSGYSLSITIKSQVGC
jgi:hypothetical protein